MSIKRNEQLDVADEIKEKLGNSISNFIASKKSDSYSQAEFAKDIDEKMGLSIEWYQDQDERVKRAKNVSRWIHKNAFPSIEVLIAISKVLNVSLDKLFESVTFEKSKTKELSDESKMVLKMLLDEMENKESLIASLYFPYAFNGETLCISERVFSRKEVVEIYKKLIWLKQNNAVLGDKVAGEIDVQTYENDGSVIFYDLGDYWVFHHNGVGGDKTIDTDKIKGTVYLDTLNPSNTGTVPTTLKPYQTLIIKK